MSGVDGRDEGHMGTAGFRLDWQGRGKDALLLVAAARKGETHQNQNALDRDLGALVGVESVTDVRGGHIMGSWERSIADGADMVLRAYYDRSERLLRFFDYVQDTWDLDVQLRLEPGARHQLVVGGGYRLAADDTQGGFRTYMIPADRTLQSLNFFAQDEISLLADHLDVVLGSKFEHSTYTGWEIQPNLRWAWKIGHSQVVWGAVSRAARLPTRSERDMRIATTPLPLFPGAENAPQPILFIRENRRFDSEILQAYEAGYRFKPNDRSQAELTVFYNAYSDLRGSLPGGDPFVEADFPPPYLVIPLVFGNGLEGAVYGAEIERKWQVRDNWRLRAFYAYGKVDLQLKGGGESMETAEAEGGHPSNQGRLESQLDLAGGWELDGTLHYRDELPAWNVDAAVDLSLRLGWRSASGWEWSLVGANLLYENRAEFGLRTDIIPSQRQRNIYVMCSWGIGAD